MRARVACPCARHARREGERFALILFAREGRYGTASLTSTHGRRLLRRTTRFVRNGARFLLNARAPFPPRAVAPAALDGVAFGVSFAQVLTKTTVSIGAVVVTPIDTLRKVGLITSIVVAGPLNWRCHVVSTLTF